MITDNNRPIMSIIKQLRKFKKNLNNPDSPKDLFEKCSKCGNLVSIDRLKSNYYTCPNCSYHFNIRGKQRIDILLKDYKILNKKAEFVNPIDFPEYKEKYMETKKETGLDEGIITADGYLYDIRLVVVSLDNTFFMGSMGCYIGEEITKAFEYAGNKNLPIIVFSTSGGARMQEGIFSLMQMAKTSMAVKRYHKTKNLYISYMTHPTTGGVTASFAFLGDIILAEPDALIGFAGPRVIKETIKGKLPEGFQRSEFLLKKGFLDEVVDRKHMKDYIYKILKLHKYGSGGS